MKHIRIMLLAIIALALTACESLPAIETGVGAAKDVSAQASRKRVEVAQWSICDRIRMQDWLALFPTAAKRAAWATMCDVDLPGELSK